MVCQKLNILSFADKKQSRRSDRMTLGAFLMTYFTLRKCSFGHPRRSMRTSASVDTDNKSGCIKAAWVYKNVQQRLLKLRLRGYGRDAIPS